MEWLLGGVGAALPQPSFLRGVNLGNRLDAPNEGEWDAWLNDTAFSSIGSLPFDHVRLPVRFNGHAAAAPPYTLDETFMQRVDWAVDQALSNGLSIILDLHHYDELHADPDGHAERFLALWEQIATRYASRPATVAFELLNEPHGALVPQRWNELAAQAVAVVRRSNPTRLLVVDAASWAGIGGLAALVLPDDPNLMASVHSYDPVLFTLQGGQFAGPAFDTVGVVYPGPPPTPIVPNPGARGELWPVPWFDAYNSLPGDANPCSRAAIARQFVSISDYRAATGHAVYNGEWGVTAAADLASRAAWLRDVRTESERLGIGWATWDGGGDAQLFDGATGVWNETLLSALFD